MSLALLKETVYRQYPLPPEVWEAFAACWQPVTFLRKSVITAAGDVERYGYFVTEGVQRAFYEEGDTSCTIMFSYTGSFSGVLDSFLLQTPSRYFLEALTPTRMLRMSHTAFEQLSRDHPVVERWMRHTLAQVVAGLLERQVELLTCSAEQKFRILLTRSPHVLQLIPQKYLAGYLGIDPATFSKLLKTVKL